MARRADKTKLGLTGVPSDAKLTPQQQIIADYQVTFASGSGARVLKDLQVRFEKRRSFVPDSNATAFHEGQRDIVRLIENYLEADALVTTTVNTDEEQD